jgi:hypothetical protein
MTARRILVCALAVLAAWIAYDLAVPARGDLRDFDPHDVARLETAMWRSYYDHHQVRLFGELTTLLQRQFHLPFWRACLGAYYAGRSAVVFQAGHARQDYERALPDLVRYYSLIRRASATPFDVERVGRLELDWWIVHRERDRRPAGDLDHALAELQSAIYSRPDAAFAEHARRRAEAMLLRDAGGDWSRIAELLDNSWVSLHTAVR